MAPRTHCQLVSLLAVLVLLTTSILGTPVSRREKLANLSGRGIAMPMVRKPRTPSNRRQNITAGLANVRDYGVYTVDVSLGTPPQPVSLQLDTGSSDTWAFGPSACEAIGCVGGSFNTENSSTFTTVSKNGFNIAYGDGSHVKGDYISDKLAFSSATITSLEMGWAKSAKGSVYVGIMGVGLDTNEAAKNQYPNLVDEMVSQGLIEHGLYSLWLDDLESSTGTVLFGGYDCSKFSGSLVSLPLNPKAGIYREFSTNWTSLSVTNSSGSFPVTSTVYSTSALFDSGTTLTQIPSAIYNQLTAYFRVSSEGLIDCNFNGSAGTINFGFPGVKISVPFSEMILSNGDSTCEFGLASSDEITILGDTFLRSAYVVYDLEHKAIALAQTVFV